VLPANQSAITGVALWHVKVGDPGVKSQSRPDGHSASGRIKPVKNSNRTHDLPTCSAVPHSAALTIPNFISSSHITEICTGCAELIWNCSKEIGFILRNKSVRYVVMSRDQNAGQIQSINTDNTLFESVE
jgi:hypothetical protein